MFPGEFTVGHFLGQRVDSYLLCQELAQVLRRQERCLSDQCHHTRALEFVQLVSDQFLSNEGATGNCRLGESSSNAARLLPQVKQ